MTVMTLDQALQAAPPVPTCMPGNDRREWADYLMHCQNTDKRESRKPFDAASVFKPSFNFCRECAPAHARAMLAAGRCKPDQYRVIPIAAVAVAEPQCV